MATDSLLHIVSHFNIIFGITLNLLVIRLVKRNSPKELGNYKYLLLCFASCDVVLLISHTIVNPQVIAQHGIYGVISMNFINNKYIIMAYGALFTVPFSLLILHFLYRYWVIKHSALIFLFDNKSFNGLLVFLFLIGGISWFILLVIGTSIEIPGSTEAKEMLAINLNSSSVDGWLIFRMDDDFALLSKITLIIFNVMMIFGMIVSFTLALLTYLSIQRAASLSQNDRSFQMALLIAVCVQTFVPFVCICIPYLYVLNVPFIDVPIPIFTDYSAFLHALFPTFDAIVIISLMRPYREGLLQLLRIKKSRI